MSRKQKKSSLLAKYSAMFERNPRSRVFAPLAESYRKLGMLDEAYRTLREGIKRHPSYVMGYVVLGHCYFDQQKYELAYNAVRPFVSDNLENISLQKLFAQICLNLGYLEEALQTFKYLLFVNPKDEYVSEQVKLLEDDLLAEEKEAPAASPAGFSEDEDEWVRVDFNGGAKKDEASEELERWSLESPGGEKLSLFKEEVRRERLDIEEHPLDDEWYFEDYDNDEGESAPDGEAKAEPIITHTLVDLYIRQGHPDKAVEILESILETHPEDSASQNRLKALKKDLAGEEPQEGTQEQTDGPDLANLVEERVKTGEERSRKTLENKLNIFLQKLKNESRRRLEDA